MKLTYHTDGIFYQQGDLFKVDGLKKTKKEAWETMCNSWTYGYRAPAKSTPSTFSHTYDLMKRFMDDTLALHPDAEFYFYNSASRSNDTNTPGGRLYTAFKTNPEEDNSDLYITYLSDYSYDCGKFITLAMFKNILGLVDLTKTDRGICKETLGQCTLDNLQKRIIQIPESIINSVNLSDETN